MTYNGIFIREYQGQQPNFSGSGGDWTASPDIVSGGPQVQDSSQFITNAGYTTTYPNTLGINQANFVWVRAVNTTQSAMTGRVWLFWAQSSLFLYPTAWQSAGISVAGQMVNYQNIVLPAAPPPPSPPPFPPQPPPVSVPAVTAMPFVVNPTVQMPTSDNFALIALVENTPSNPPTPPLPQNYFVTLGDLANWVASTPSVGWLDVAPPATPGPLLQTTLAVSSGGGGTFQVQAACYGLPTDGKVGLECPGPEITDSADLYQVAVTSPNMTLGKQVTWPASFATTITVSFWQGSTPPPQGAAIRPVLLVLAN